MDLFRIATPLRTRKPWEAADLGLAMVRTWWPKALLAWCLIAVPAYAIAVSLLPLGWAMLLVWWLRPIFERLPLFVYSRGMFGALPNFQQILEALPGLTFRGSFAALTWRRFDPVRSFHSPVLQLEGLRGAPYKKRCSILDRTSYSAAIALTLIGPWLEMILSSSILMLMLFFIPTATIETEFEHLVDTGELSVTFGVTITSAVIMFLSATLCELIYSASGFALYISRRQELEGWDVELAFRRLAIRITEAESKQSTAKKGKAGAATLLLAFLALTIAAPIKAQNPVGPQQPARTIIDEVLADDDFSRSHEQFRWLPRDLDSESSGNTDRTIDSSGIGGAFAEVTRLLIIIAFVILLLLALWYLAKNLNLRGQAVISKEAPPDIIFGLDIRPESLPDDVPAEARKLLSKGEITACLSLLYRASLADLVTHHELPIQRSSTEHDCMLLVQQNTESGEASYFRDLTAAWQSCAYGNKIPPNDLTLTLCSSWHKHFGDKS